MKLLIDTHIWLHSVLAPRRVGRKIRAALDNPRNEAWLSPISIVELILLVRSGRIRTVGDPGLWARNALASTSLIEAPLTHEIAIECDNFEIPGADPFDRVIVATARVLDMTLVTHDDIIVTSGTVAVLTDN